LCEPPLTLSELRAERTLRSCGALDREEDSMSKVWLITCKCRALVQALADAVLASGHNLVATAIDPEPLRELVERYGDQLRIVPLEVTDASAVETAIEATLGAFGKLDVLVLDLAKWHSRLTDQAFQKVVASPELTVPPRPNDSSAHAAP